MVYNTHMQLVKQFEPAVEPIWTKALSYEDTPWPFFTYRWHESWQRIFGAHERPAVFMDNELIIPLSIHGTTAHFTGGEEIADYLDAIGRSEKKAQCWKSALEQLRRLGAKDLLLRNIPQESPTLVFFKTIAGASVSEEDTTPILPLPASFEEYVAGLERKQRHELRRKMRRFEEEQKAIELRQTAPDIELLLRLMRHNEEKRAFLTPSMEAFFRELAQIAPDTLTQLTLVVSNEPIATTAAFEIDRSLLLYNSGYLPRVIGSGWYLKAKIIQWCIERHLTSVNFLQGGERYKYDFGAADRPLYRVNLTL